MQAYGIVMVERIQKSIEIIADGLAQLQDTCYVVGSSALVLAGIELENIDDVDLLTSNRDAAFLKQLWKIDWTIILLLMPINFCRILVDSNLMKY